MSAAQTKTQIASAVEQLTADVPALANLKLVVKLELAARGGDAPIWRIALPGPEIDRDPAADARIAIVVQRQDFNALTEEGTLRDWARAYDRGRVKVAGDSSVIKLLGNVFERHLARSS